MLSATGREPDEAPIEDPPSIIVDVCRLTVGLACPWEKKKRKKELWVPRDAWTKKD
jgi:hypothetical protein